MSRRAIFGKKMGAIFFLTGSEKTLVNLNQRHLRSVHSFALLVTFLPMSLKLLTNHSHMIEKL